MRATAARTIKKPPALLEIMFRLPWFLKFPILANRWLWRIYTGICRRIGWDDSQLGWYIPNNGPYAGIQLPALHTNFLWVPLGGYEPILTCWLVRILTGTEWGAAGGDFWDVGAHRGYTSLLCVKHGSGRVLAFEPDTANVSSFRENLKTNPGLSERIELLPVAVADTDGEMELKSPQDDPLQCQLVSSDIVPRAQRFDAVTVAKVGVVSLDSLVASGRKPPAVLKVDVEGAEFLVLRGAANLLRQFHPLVLLEYHNLQAQKMCVASLRELGYTLFALNGMRLRELEENSSYGHLLAVYRQSV